MSERIAADAPESSAAAPSRVGGAGVDVLARARLLADDVLFPAAQDVDRARLVPPRPLRALAHAGLFGVAGPRSHGGLELPVAELRRVVAVVGGGCGATFFVWVQHHSVVRALRASPNEALVTDVLSGLCAGELIAGVAFAHVRRPGRPAVSATRIHEGWRLDGVAPWATSWGIADRFAVAAVSDDGDLVWVLVAGDGEVGVRATPLALPVFTSTGTVSLTFDACDVPDTHVIRVEPLEAWRRTDRRTASIGQPAVLGVAERAVRLLEEHGAAGDRDAAVAATRLREGVEAAWVRDDELVGDLFPLVQAGLGGGDRPIDDDELLVAASDHRAACLHLARRATTALLAAVGGRGMDLSHPAQRLAREADFYVIQAQTADGRAATLRSV